VEPSDVRLDLPERTISMDSSEIKIGEIRDGAGNVTVTGRILTAETRNITVKGEGKVVYSGMIADDSGKIQYSAWNDYNLKEGETVRIENAYIRTWKGIPQLNLGDRCEVSRVDDTFGTIDTGCSRKTVGEIVRIGGGLDITVSGTVVDMRQGSGLINRCPQCNRSVLNDECTAHGKVVPVPDLRMKLTVDDGTGALSAIVNRECTTKLTGVTLDSAVQLAKARGDNYVVAKALAEKMMMKRVKISGNVMSDEYGPMMIVRDADFEKVDVIAEATKLLDSVEAAL
jgi:replication factor A1